jgi:hypothetical protein
VRVAIEVGFPCYITEIKANGDSLVLPGTKATDEEANRGIGKAKGRKRQRTETLREFEGPMKT